MNEPEKTKKLRSKRAKSIGDVLEEVDVLIDMYFFNEFSEPKSSGFLKKVISNQSSIEMNLLKKTWRTLKSTPKTMKIIRELQDNILCVRKRN